VAQPNAPSNGRPGWDMAASLQLQLLVGWPDRTTINPADNLSRSGNASDIALRKEWLLCLDLPVRCNVASLPELFQRSTPEYSLQLQLCLAYDRQPRNRGSATGRYPSPSLVSASCWIRGGGQVGNDRNGDDNTP
jgi:hypothetical protein